ncbi:WD repeat-containing protein 89-like isoform X2 [Branchiostoma lanceolatum]|uniref:WD repeat-containing protein 89-like isoform X2 n=1 Tax=Branchiostoma lanceolatum TaxID=7740 RepID=UPI003454535A
MYRNMPKHKPERRAKPKDEDEDTSGATNAAYIFDIAGQASSAPGTGDGLLAAMGSNNSVQVYQATTLALEHRLEGHTDIVSGVKFAHTNPSMLYSSSLDGTIRCCDLRVSNKKPAQILKGYEGDQFFSLDVNCDDTVVCGGCQKRMPDTNVVFWDSRTGQIMHTYPDSHSDDITQVNFHPSIPHKLASGSTDGLISIFDVRQSDEDDAVENVLNTESSVSRIGWYGPNSDKLYCVTHVETLQLWDADEADQIGNFEDIKDYSGKELDHHAPVATIKHMKDKEVATETDDGTKKSSALGPDYLVDCYWDAQQQKLLLAGGLHSGRLNVYKVKRKKKTLKPLYSLGDGHLSTIRCLHWQDKTQSLVTGGEDGLLCLWKPGVDLEKETKDLSLTSQAMPGKASSSVRTRLRLHTKKPY